MLRARKTARAQKVAATAIMWGAKEISSRHRYVTFRPHQEGCGGTDVHGADRSFRLFCAAQSQHFWDLQNFTHCKPSIVENDAIKLFYLSVFEIINWNSFNETVLLIEFICSLILVEKTAQVSLCGWQETNLSNQNASQTSWIAQ
jgi:hypothetical protein